MIPKATVDHYKRVQRLQVLGILAARRAWAGVDAGALSASWQSMLPGVVAAVSLLQVRAAGEGASYGAATLAQQGLYEAPEFFVNPESFGGFASDGRALDGLLYAAVPHTKRLIAGGMAPVDAVRQGGKFLEMVTKTQVADAGRGAAGVDMATKPNVGYVRMLNPPSCSRCSVLAGKFYRWNAGFPRHPGCDCVHVQSTEAASAEGLIHDPYEYFEGLSAAEQDRLYTKSGAQAIRDGGDIFQVVNSRRGMKPGGLITTEGTSKRGNYGLGKAPRLTPEGIYSQGKSRAETLRLLESNGYILPGGQDPAGALRAGGGYGQMARGGTRVGARQAVERARLTGERNPSTRATMTAAELRYFDAQMNWDAVSRGRNPFGRGKLTPELAAAVELDFRRVVLSGDPVAKLTARARMAGN